MLARRRFLGAILASACAPAIVRASSLMPLSVPAVGRSGLSFLMTATARHYDNYGSYGTVSWAMVDKSAVLNEQWLAFIDDMTISLPAGMKDQAPQIAELNPRALVLVNDKGVLSPPQPLAPH